jgi:hypothetical protein
MMTIGLIVTFLGNASASPKSITVQGASPVAKALQLKSLQREPAAQHRTLVPKGGSFSFTLSSANSDELGAVEALVKSYNASRGGDPFTVVQGAGPLQVVPRNMIGKPGAARPLPHSWAIKEHNNG